MDYVFLGIFGSGGEKGNAAGDFGAGSFSLDKKGCLVLGVQGRCQWRSWRRVSEDKDSGAKDLTGAFDLWSSIFGVTDVEGDGSWEKAGAEERCRGRSWRRMSEVTLVSKERGPGI